MLTLKINSVIILVKMRLIMIMIEKDGMYFDWFRVKFIKSNKPLKEQHTRHYGSIKAALKNLLRYGKSTNVRFIEV